MFIGDAVFVHDKAPCMRANATQQLLKQANFELWGNDIWPRKSRDLNVAENIGAILKDEVEAQMLAEIGPGRYSYETSPKMWKT